MKPNVGPDEVQNKLSAFSHKLSLNENKNVRKDLFHFFIYPRGVGKRKGRGVSLDIFV